MNLAELQTAVDAATAQAQANVDGEEAAEALLVTLGGLLAQNANNPALIQAMGDALAGNTSKLNTSAAKLAAAVVAGTPIA